jgi:hypothetical protein
LGIDDLCHVLPAPAATFDEIDSAVRRRAASKRH